MNIPWKPIMDYRLGDSSAQAAYDAIFKAALSYKMSKAGLVAMPVSNQTLTDAIFKLNSHDQLKLGNKTVDGQKVKELFITTIVLKHLEDQLSVGDHLFIVLPEEEGSCDTAVFVSKKRVPMQVMGDNKLKLSPDHHPFFFQVKEYADFGELPKGKIELPGVFDPEEIAKLVQGYSEYMLVFIRKFFDYKSEDIKDFFKNNPNCCLISSSSEVNVIPKGSTTGEYEPVKLDPNRHNYVITLANETFTVASFARPAFLVEENKVLPKQF